MRMAIGAVAVMAAVLGWAKAVTPPGRATFVQTQLSAAGKAAGDAAPPALSMTFDDQPPGPIGESDFRRAFPAVESALLGDRASIVPVSSLSPDPRSAVPNPRSDASAVKSPSSPDPRSGAKAKATNPGSGGNALVLRYPRGAVGPKNGGGLFIARVEPAPEYTLTYRVRFSNGFDFRNGGKLPGLSSGGGRYSGSRVPKTGDGWSARMRFGPNGEAAVYLYYVDMPGDVGVVLPLGGARFEPGRWHTIVQRVRVNDGDAPNGAIQVWLDGELRLDRRDLRLRLGGKGLVDSLCFSTFHGGSRQEDAPRRDGEIAFDELVVQR